MARTRSRAPRASAPEPGGDADLRDYLVSWHLRFGWWSLLVFATLGLGLEVLHGFKVGFYLDVGNETRRLLWTLAHAHGVLIGLLHIAFAASVAAGLGGAVGPARTVSPLLMSASVLLPGGFFLGGAITYGGDPGLGVFLTPIGAACLLAALFLIARASQRT